MLSTSDSKLVLSTVQKIRSKCLSDLFWFAKYVLGYAELSPDLHRPLCAIVQSVNPLLLKNVSHETIILNSLHTNNLQKSDNVCETGNSIKYGASYNVSDISKYDGESEFGGGGGGGGPDSITYPPIQNRVKFSDDLLNNKVFLKYSTLRDESRERLFLLFRGSFKTTIISIAHTIQLMLLWPDIRILICSHKKEGGSQEILAAIKRQFVSNPKLRAFFPEYCPKPNGVGVIEWGTSEKITLPNRSSDCAWPEATVEIAGLTTDVTGRHYDYIKNDDLVTRDSVTNETMIQKTRQFKALQKFLFNQPEWGITDNIGTFYHFNDLYSQLSKSDKLTKVIIPAVKDDQIPWQSWEPTFPQRFSSKGLYDIRTDPSMNLYDWSCQYMMNPVPPEDQTFRPEWFERLGFFYDIKELEGKPLRVNIYVDPAAKRRKKSDFTALIVIGVDDNGKKYLLDMLRDKLGPESRTSIVIKFARKWNIHSVHYETVGFQDTDRYIIERKSREEKFPINVTEISASNASKEDRIKGLQPIYERGDIRWPREYFYFSSYEQKKLNMIEILRDEMLMFPRSEHDDLIDCHSQMLQVPEYKASKVPVERSDDEFERLRKIMVDKRHSLTKKPNYLGNSDLIGRKKIFEIPFKRAFR